MKFTRTLLMLLVAALGSAASAFADGCPTPDEVKATKNALPAAQAAEKAGKMLEALNLYVAAQAALCEEPNRNAAAAAQRAAAIALPLGKAAEQKGDARLAFEVYEMGGHFAAADRNLLAMMKAAPDDISIFSTHQNHFVNRATDLTNRKEAAAATGPYRMDSSLKHEWESWPVTAIERTMAAEAAAFSEPYLRERLKLVQSRPEPNPADMQAMQNAMAASTAFQQKWKEDPLKVSLQHLTRARQWAGFTEPDTHTATDARIVARAEERALTLTAKWSGAPEFLDAAASYYRSVESTHPAAQRIAQIKAQAMTLGDEWNARGRFTLAIEYYELADSPERADAARERQRVAAMKNMQPQIDQMQRDAVALAQELAKNPAAIEALKKQAAAAAEAARRGNGSQPNRSDADLERELGLR